MKRNSDLVPVFEPFSALRSQLDRLFEDFFGSWPSLERSHQFYAPMDVYEDREAVYVKMDLPGLTQKDVQISLEGHRLTIKGQRRSEEEYKDRHTHRVERRYGEFLRTVDLPDTVDPNRAQATFKDGVLTVKLGKKPEAKAKVIEIEAK